MNTLVHTLVVEDDFDMEGYRDALTELSAGFCGCEKRNVLDSPAFSCAFAFESSHVHAHSDDEWVDVEEVVKSEEPTLIVKGRE